jgi:hypothetical protein
MEAEKSRERMKEENYILDCDKAKEVKYYFIKRAFYRMDTKCRELGKN